MNLLSREKKLFALMKTPDELHTAIHSLEKNDEQASNRQIQHWNAKYLMLTGNLEKALSEMTVATTMFGSHLGLKTDIAHCYYLMGIYQMFEKTVNELYLDYFKFRDELNPLNRVRSALGIGKLLEETAHLQQAYELYQDMYRLIQNEIADPLWINEYQQLYFRITAQCLRFSTQYGFASESIKAYELLCLVQNKFLYIQGAIDEVEHAKFLYEMEYYSKSINFYELSENLRNKKMSQQTINLCKFEYVEFFLKHNLEINKNIDQSDLDPKCSYDYILYSLYKNRENIEDIVTGEIKKLSRSSLIRSLLLYNIVLKKKLPYHLNILLKASMSHLSSESINLWNAWSGRYQSGNFDIVLHLKKFYLIQNSDKQEINLNNKDLIYSFLLLFINVKTISWQELSEKLWERPALESDYDRIRMLVNRVNKTINPLQKAFLFKKNYIQTHINILKKSELDND